MEGKVVLEKFGQQKHIVKNVLIPTLSNYFQTVALNTDVFVVSKSVELKKKKNKQTTVHFV